MPIGPGVARYVEDNHIPASRPHRAGDGAGRHTSKSTCVFPVPGLWTANLPTPCFPSPCCQCPLLLYLITLNAGEGRCSRESCQRSVLSLLKLGESLMYRDSVLCSISLLNFLKIFQNNCFVASTMIREEMGEKPLTAISSFQIPQLPLSTHTSRWGTSEQGIPCSRKKIASF